MAELPFLDAAAIRAACSPAAAVAALTAALTGDIDPGRDPQRVGVDLAAGQFLLMPSEHQPPTGAATAGIKVVTIASAPATPTSPRIKGLYLMFDGVTLAPTAILDGIALTTLRTPAVSVAAVQSRLRGSSAPLRVVVFGAGPQATGHVECLADTLAGVRPLGAVHYVVRQPDRVAREDLVGGDVSVVAAGSGEAEAAVRAADVVVCATTARTPVVVSASVSDDAVVIAVGSHEPDARELDPALLARSTVVVEHLPTALREAGDVIMALAEGAVSESDLVELRDAIAGPALPTDRPLVFKSVGMSWEDLVVAEAVLAGHTG